MPKTATELLNRIGLSAKILLFSTNDRSKNQVSIRLQPGHEPATRTRYIRRFINLGESRAMPMRTRYIILRKVWLCWLMAPLVAS